MRLKAASPSAATSFPLLAWTTVGFNLFVIVWGAFVRATGSGAGCGSHWPLCNGEVVPRAPAMATLIELGHRLTSGVALLLVVALVVVAWRRYPPRHVVRRAAAVTLALMLVEALIGAGLVLFEMVADNASVARGFWVAGHLFNTFLLLAAMSLTAWWASSGESPRGRLSSTVAVSLALALGGVLLLGVSGAITALGDTLFPSASLEEAKAMTFSESAHIFVRLRIWHPTLAVLVGGIAGVAAWLVASTHSTAAASRLATAIISLYALQLGVGLVNVWLLAPVWIQLVHLLLSDLIWIALVLLTAHSLAESGRAGLPRPA